MLLIGLAIGIVAQVRAVVLILIGQLDLSKLQPVPLSFSPYLMPGMIFATCCMWWLTWKQMSPGQLRFGISLLFLGALGSFITAWLFLWSLFAMIACTVTAGILEIIALKIYQNERKTV